MKNVDSIGLLKKLVTTPVTQSILYDSGDMINGPNLPKRVFLELTIDELRQLMTSIVEDVIERRLIFHNKDDPDTEFINTAAACQLLGVSRGTLLKRVKDGTISRTKKKGKVYYSKDKLINFLNSDDE